MRNLEQFSAGIGSDFNVDRPLSRVKITEGLFQQNRPKADIRNKMLSYVRYRCHVTNPEQVQPLSGSLVSARSRQRNAGTART